jgi:hypothetical protein
LSKLYVDELHPKTTGAQVTIPNKPAWRVVAVEEDFTATGTYDVEWANSSSLNDLTQDNALFVRGGCVLEDSNHAIKVPVDGFYAVNANMRIDNVGSGYVSVQIKVNNSGTATSQGIQDDPGASYQSFSLSEVLYLRANDKVTVTATTNSDTAWEVENNSVFNGIFIG